MTASTGPDAGAAPAARAAARRLGAIPIAACCVALLVAGAACTKESVVAGIGAPGTKAGAEISDVSVRYRYIDAFVAASGFRYRLLFPDREPCKTLVRDGSGATFVWMGTVGRLVRGDDTCDAVGVLSLAAWRDRGPRRSREPLPRGQASFREVWRDEEMVMVRGRFPLASMANWAGGYDTIAVLPDSEACRGFLAQGVASMEFRATGPAPLVLLDGSHQCPIIGFAQPLPDAPAE